MPHINKLDSLKRKMDINLIKPKLYWSILAKEEGYAYQEDWEAGTMVTREQL